MTPPGQGAGPLLAELRRAFVPNRVLLVVPEGEQLAALSQIVPLAEGKSARDGKATAYVCQRGVCELPTADPGIFAKQIRTVSPLAAQ